MSAPKPDVLRMAAPLIVSFWMRALFSFVDTIYASKLGPGSDAAVAAIGLSFPFEFLMIAVWIGLSTGLTSNLSRAMGAGADDRVEQHLRVSTRLVWVCVPVFAAIGGSLWFLAPAIAKDPQVARQFAIYGTVLVGGSAFSMFWSVIPDSIVKAHADTKATMWAGIWSNLVNVVLNTLFTFVFGWGIFGIAFSTVVSRFAGLWYALHKAAEHEARRRERDGPRDPALDPHPYRSTFALAIPAALAYALMAAESAIVNGLLLRLESATEAVAAYAIFYRTFQFAVMPVIATAVAMLPFAARRFGERDVGGIKDGLRRAHLAALAYTALLVPILWFVAEPIAAFLAESQKTLDFAAFTLRLVPLGVVTSISFFLVRPVFEGMGTGRPGLVMALVRYALLTAPLAWIGSRVAQAWALPGMYGLVVGLMAAAAVASAIFLVWVRIALRREGVRGGNPAPPLS